VLDRGGPNPTDERSLALCQRANAHPAENEEKFNPRADDGSKGISMRPKHLRSGKLVSFRLGKM
jgi:hypothetical protein